MRIVVLLSAGIHPVSGRPRPVAVETQAIRLARSLGATIGMHAGPSSDPADACLGHGIAEMVWLRMPADCDAVAVLVASLRDDPPDLVLAGHRAEGGADTGLLPYLVAQQLGWPIANDAVALRAVNTGLIVTQALPAGQRRDATVGLPTLVTVAPGAPAALPFAYGAAKRGKVIERLAVAEPVPAIGMVERPYRRRPRLVRGAPAGGDAATRLRQATEAVGVQGKMLVDPTPEAAAVAILEYLRGLDLAPDRQEEQPPR